MIKKIYGKFIDTRAKFNVNECQSLHSHWELSENIEGINKVYLKRK